MIADPAQTVARFFRALDDRDYATLGGLLAEGGVWHRQGAELRSLADIEAAMAKRSPTMRIHHLLTNLYAEAIGDDEATVVGYMLVVRHDSGAVPAGPSPLQGIETIRTMRGRLRRSADGWRIVHLAGDAPSFAAEGG
jgi:hypothetical protein